MTIDKALEILSLDLTYTYPAKFEDLQVAISLGIEALKRVRNARGLISPYTAYLLLGETEP